MDTNIFYQKLLETAQSTYYPNHGPEEAAREALKEAHALLSQELFFQMLDLLGGRNAVIERVAMDLHGE